MVEDTGRSRLGRGLAALLGDVGEEAGAVERARGQRRVPVGFLRPNPRNPRRVFGEAELGELAASIREKGVIQPILVRSVPQAVDAYEIIAGERRWRAAQLAGIHELPILILEVGDREALEIAIIENVQRADLNPLEEAKGYQDLIDGFSYTQQDLAKVIGKSRSHVANTLRLLKLPETVRRFIDEGQLSAGHARALLAHADPAVVAERVIAEGLNVRQVEALAQEEAERSGRAPQRRERREKDPDTRALEERLSAHLGLVVVVDHREPGGEMRIRYRSLDQLDGLVRLLEG